MAINGNLVNAVACIVPLNKKISSQNLHYFVKDSWLNGCELSKISFDSTEIMPFMFLFVSTGHVCKALGFTNFYKRACSKTQWHGIKTVLSIVYICLEDGNLPLEISRNLWSFPGLRDKLMILWFCQSVRSDWKFSALLSSTILSSTLVW